MNRAHDLGQNGTAVTSGTKNQKGGWGEKDADPQRSEGELTQSCGYSCATQVCPNSTII